MILPKNLQYLLEDNEEISKEERENRKNQLSDLRRQQEEREIPIRPPLPPANLEQVTKYRQILSKKKSSAYIKVQSFWLKMICNYSIELII